MSVNEQVNSMDENMSYVHPIIRVIGLVQRAWRRAHPAQVLHANL